MTHETYFHTNVVSYFIISIYWLITLNRDFINTSPHIIFSQSCFYFCECKNKIFSFPLLENDVERHFCSWCSEHTSMVLTVPLKQRLFVFQSRDDSLYSYSVFVSSNLQNQFSIHSIFIMFFNKKMLLPLIIKIFIN